MSNLIASIQETVSTTQAKATEALDHHIKPDTRRQYYNNLKSWAEQNPRLAAFAATHLALSGPPVIFFALFMLFTFLSTIVTCLTLALVATLTFTSICFGGAVLILIPTLFISTVSATFLFAWCAVGYSILQYLQQHPRTAPYVDAAKQNAYQTTQRAETMFRNTAQKLEKTAQDILPNKPGDSASVIESDTRSVTNSDDANDASHQINDSATAVRDYFGNVDGSATVYGGNTKVVADTSKSSSGMVTPGGTLPRNRSYSKNSAAARRPRKIDGGDLEKSMGADLDVKRDTVGDSNGDVTPLALEQDGFIPVNGARPAETGSLRGTVAPV